MIPKNSTKFVDELMTRLRTNLYLVDIKIVDDTVTKINKNSILYVTCKCNGNSKPFVLRYNLNTHGEPKIRLPENKLPIEEDTLLIFLVAIQQLRDISQDIIREMYGDEISLKVRNLRRGRNDENINNN